VRIVVATFNEDKRRELEALLAWPDLELVSMRSFAGASSPDEDGDTLLENAFIKARAAHAMTGLPVIADDTGLEVDALGGRPGIHAARYAGPGATYDDNVARLVAELEGVPAARRTARFRTVCAAVLANGGELHAEGVLEGRIVEAARGTNGFGYDPVFEIAELGRTLAELSAEEKNARSHRARAVRALAADPAFAALRSGSKERNR
jgi:XTP/dITP diphosphohydrolase